MSRKSSFSLSPPVQWHEGMMLAPQHFQRLEVRNEQKLNHHLGLLPHPHWGLSFFTLDPITFPNGLVKVTALEAIMPDGLIVTYVENDFEELPLVEYDLNPHKQDLMTSSDLLWLCIPDFGAKGQISRYISVEDQAVDFNTLEKIKVPCIMPRIFLSFGPTPPSWAYGFPIMRIKFSDGIFVPVAFTAPALVIPLDHPLQHRCEAIVQTIREKASYLTERCQTLVGTSLFLETSLQLRTLNHALLTFEHFVHKGEQHPLMIYNKVCEVAGILSGFRLSQVPPVLPNYEHSNIDDIFSVVFDLIDLFLQSLENDYYIHQFSQKERLFYIQLASMFCSNQKFYVGIRSPRHMGRTEVYTWMMECIIASDFSVDTVRHNRTTGAKRQLLEGEKFYKLSVSLDISVFEIELDPRFIKTEQVLHIFNPSDSTSKRPLELMLYTFKEEKTNS